MTYAELVAALPLPTLEQTWAFAEHVADNHSWYKHLPLFPPGATFVFFLAPHVGEEIERTDTGYVTRPLDRGDYFRHHSRYATDEYREQFGHWDYWVDNPRAHGPVERPFLDGIGVEGREPLPADLARRWACQLTAFLKLGPIRTNEYWLERDAFREYAGCNPADPNVERYLPVARQDATQFTWPHGPNRFVLAETCVQRQLLLQALLSAREDCAEMQARATEPL
jgi:hypothetical protein